MFRTDLIAAAAVTMIAAATPATVVIVAANSDVAVVASAQAGAAVQLLTGEFWNGSRWNGVFTDETALSDDAIDAMLAALEPMKAAA